MAQQLADESNLLDIIETSLVLIETSCFNEYIVFCDQLTQCNICCEILQKKEINWGFMSNFDLSRMAQFKYIINISELQIF